MAKFVPFAWSPHGQLVYRNTGRLAPDTYSVRGNTVYGSDGRKVGNVSKNPTAAQKERIQKADRSRQHRKAQQIKGKPSQKKPKAKKPRKPKATAEPIPEERDPDVPESEEYYYEYVNLIAEYGKLLNNDRARQILMNATVEEAEILHELAYDIYEPFVEYGGRVKSGSSSPHDRAVFERQGLRLAQLLWAVKKR